MADRPLSAEAEIACRQILSKDMSVFSAQWTILPGPEAGRVTPAFLLERYLAHIRLATGFLVHPFRHERTVEFRLLGSRLSLLSFSIPPIAAGEEQRSVTLQLAGGLLVQPEECRRGELIFACELVAEGMRATLQLADYCPLILGTHPGRLRRRLYGLTQAAMHRLVTVRFFVRLHRELAGRRVCCRVVRVRRPGDLEI